MDNRIEEKENEKIQKYENLRREMKQIWNLKSVHVIPVVIGALGAITGRFHSWIKSIRIEVRVKKLAGSEYVRRHDNALKVLACIGQLIINCCQKERNGTQRYGKKEK